jgi:type VI secretion system protein ImpM
MAVDDAPGWYGKLSMLGDFATRRLDASWVRACDQWLSASLRTSQEALGERWMSVYLAAPVWRFAWGPGIVDGRWWFGVLMPSCDSVGRYFPLVIAQPRVLPPADRIALDHLDLWWSALARAGLDTLADGATLQAFEARLIECPPWPRGAPPGRVRPQMAPDRVRYLLGPGATPADVAQELAAAVWQQSLRNASVWWPAHDGRGESSCTVCQGLPDAQAFASLLDGQW